MKLAIALGTSLMLVPTLSFAGPIQKVLPAGKPGGIRQAQEAGNTTLYVIGGVTILGIIVVAASGGDTSAPTTVAPVPTQH
jgi:hypothetical protein